LNGISTRRKAAGQRRGEGRGGKGEEGGTHRAPFVACLIGEQLPRLLALNLHDLRIANPPGLLDLHTA